MRNILILSQVIPQWYVDTLANALGGNTHIDIITGSEVRGNVIVAPQHDPRSFSSRIVCWIKFYQFVKRWMNENGKRHYDLIFAISNPPINSYIGLLLKRQFKAPLVYMNWDLYPQVIEYGVKNAIGKIVGCLWHKWNNRCYPKIDRMLTIGNVMAETMNSGLRRKIDIEVVPIAVDTERLRPINREQNGFAIEHGFSDKFVVLYSGKMGMGHNIELILKASEFLKESEDILFVFIGGGPKYSVVEQYINDNVSHNIRLFPMQSEEVFPLSMACGDIGIVSQEASMAHLFMPSKTYSMMACGEAIIGISSQHDDLTQLINDNGIGYSVTDNSALTVAKRIKELYYNRALLGEMKANARRLAETKFSIMAIEKKYSAIFNSL